MRTFAHPTRKTAQSPGLMSPSVSRPAKMPTIHHILRGPQLQPKLKVCPANNKYEKEADRVADKVMRMSDAEAAANATRMRALQPPPPKAGAARRLCSDCAEELRRKTADQHLQRQAEEDKEEVLQAKPACGGTGEVSGTAEAAIHALKGSGKRLAAAEQTFFENRFGRSFDAIRIHDGDAADRASRAINARAFTVGTDIAFAHGKHEANTQSGRWLMAHELVHTLQQSSVPSQPAGRQSEATGSAFSGERITGNGRMRRSTASHDIANTSSNWVQRNPSVGYVVHSLNRDRGRLDNPDQQTTPGAVSWPLSFAVTSPLEAQADVEVTGGPGDTCTNHEIGFLQTVHSNWLSAYYWGASSGHGSTILTMRAPSPIRDGPPGTMWYATTAHEAPSGCNTHVTPSMDDYPTIFQMAKMRTNSRTGQPNYLTGVRRGIAFVTTLVASTPTGVTPLRYFYWNYQMSIDFTPNRSNVNAVWPHNWNLNRANIGRVHTGQDRTVPIFTSASAPYGSSIAQGVNERM